MKESKDAFDVIEELQKEAKQYADLRIQLLKADATDKVAQASGQMVAFMCIGILLLVTFLFLSLVGGFYFTDIFGSAIMGFGLIAIFYLIFTIIIILFRNSILVKPISNKVVSILYEEDFND